MIGYARPNKNKVKLQIKVLVDRPGMNDRFFITNIFVPKIHNSATVQRKLNRKYLNRFPTGYVYPILIKEVHR